MGISSQGTMQKYDGEIIWGKFSWWWRGLTVPELCCACMTEVSCSCVDALKLHRKRTTDALPEAPGAL